MQPKEAAESLVAVDRIRRQAREAQRTMWFPLVLFGALSLISAGVVVLFGGPALGVYWPIAGLLGGVMTARYYHVRDIKIGLEGRIAPYIAISGFIYIGALLTGGLGGALGNDMLAAVGPAVVLAAGYGMFAWLERTTMLAAIAGSLGLLAVGLWLSDVNPERATVILAVSSGCVLLSSGLAFRVNERTAYMSRVDR